MTIEKVSLVIADRSGMGADAARRFSADGLHIGILSSSGKGESLGESLGGFGITGSNRSVDAIRQLIDGAIERWGRIDVLVNPARHGPTGPVLEVSEEVSSVIASLASEDGGYMTGQILRIDGGLTRAV